ncbi:MAG TPA: undecaprenyl-diphosphate phosphatase [Thermoanaerobaculia bacterium]|nr:undecaprenyl-diphosphate phosphatase [Thermoanaerobaculia bacterium]
MTPFQAVVLSLVQAVTEFLPISSSGHLILVPYFLGWPDQGLSFDIATNTGTLLAVIIYFRADLRDLVAGVLTGEPGHHGFAPRRLATALVVGTIPAAILGLAFHKPISTHFRTPLLIAGTTFFYALVLLWADRSGRQEREIGALGWRDALLVGLAQSLALVPGTSRSGITISAGLLLGLTRPAAARFTFLLSVPIGILVGAYDLLKLWQEGSLWSQMPTILIAIAVSGAAGYVVIGWLLSYLRRQRLTVFVVYRLVLAVVIVLVVYLRGVV